MFCADLFLCIKDSTFILRENYIKYRIKYVFGSLIFSKNWINFTSKLWPNLVL